MHKAYPITVKHVRMYPFNSHLIAHARDIMIILFKNKMTNHLLEMCTPHLYPTKIERSILITKSALAELVQSTI